MNEAEASGRPQQPLRKRAARVVQQVGTPRLIVSALFVLIGIFLARYSWQVPLISDAERALYDLRLMLTTPRAEQDPRVLLVTYTDDTLINTQVRSPLDRRILADALRSLDQMGAKAIAIDVIVDQPTPNDEYLIEAFRAMKTPTFLAFTTAATNQRFIDTRQEEFLREFQAKIRTTAVKPTSIEIETDPDGVVRSWPHQPKNLPPLLARAVTGGNDRFQEYRRGVRFRLPAFEDRPVFAKLPIDLFAAPETAALMAEQVRGRYVLIGGDILDLDRFETPMNRITGERTIGLEVHAHMLTQLLDDVQFGRIPRLGMWVVALLVVAAGALTALSDAKAWKVGLMLAGQAFFFIALPFYLQWQGTDTRFLPAFGWSIGWLLAFTAVGAAVRAIGSQQRRFAQSALGKYLPRDIASEIMRDPDRLALHGEKREIFVVFTDLEGFTKLSHAIPAETVAFLLNRYLDMLSDVVLRYGGTIDKFVGDAVVAFWGAPISRPDDGERASRAAWAMYEAGEAFRKEVPEGVPAIGRTRVGLHWGEAIVGNFGGEGRIQYTALGDSMNTAARLESANKPLNSTVLASKAAVERSGLDWWRPLGRITLRGRSTPVEIFEPVPEATAEERAYLQEALRRFDAGDRTVVDELQTLASTNVRDAALANLVYRLQHMDSGGSYELG
ncbi:adenylate/guanylate cyclase domain-containing protein [Sphingomonas sp.]|uniref:adenylate/guanylate cyclase domain-containing protein n=1 Tax=Sphingomonas sp. TaxID=28214 RepID=UPI002DF170C8|nr:adenylate/guanylate cyclase domain-containing protein [Sphingomonas sp.]